MLRLLCSEPNTEVHRMTKRDNGRKAGGANVRLQARTRTRKSLGLRKIQPRVRRLQARC
jgi:hypothetical protein